MADNPVEGGSNLGNPSTAPAPLDTAGISTVGTAPPTPPAIPLIPITIYSAFKIVYLVTFIAAICDLVYVGISDVTKNTPTVKGLSQLNLWCWYFVLICFLLVVAVHIIRIYFTLDHLERQQFQYNKFYDSFSGGLRWEYLSRISLVSIVSLKAISPVTAVTLTFMTSRIAAASVAEGIAEHNVFSSLPKFLLWLYAMLCVWSVIAMCLGGKSAKEAFLMSSIAGLVGAIAVSFGQTYLTVDEVLLPANLILAGWAAYLLIDLLAYFKANGSNYTSGANLKSIFFG